MNDMLGTIVPKSTQLNADDLIGGRSLTICVTKVEIKMDEQPVAIHFEGDGGKPYLPGKSMRRVLVNIWGPDANAYVGRSMTLYRDDAVKFGGVDVGGIRISHMSHMPKAVTMALTATKAQRKPFTVKPLAEPAKPASTPPATAPAMEQVLRDAQEHAARGVEAYRGFWSVLTKPQRDFVLPHHEGLKATAAAADAARVAAEAPPADEGDDWPGPDVPPDDAAAAALGRVGA